MENEKKDWVLIAWLFTTLVWGCLIAWALWQVLFVLNRSFWWTLLALWLWSTPTLFKVLRKRYGVPEEN